MLCTEELQKAQPLLVVHWLRSDTDRYGVQSHLLGPAAAKFLALALSIGSMLPVERISCSVEGLCDVDCSCAFLRPK
jgi:hypothetical protein